MGSSAGADQLLVKLARHAGQLRLVGVGRDGVAEGAVDPVENIDAAFPCEAEGGVLVAGPLGGRVGVTNFAGTYSAQF